MTEPAATQTAGPDHTVLPAAEPSSAEPTVAGADLTADATVPNLRTAILVLSRRMRYQQASDDISSAEAAVLGRLGMGPRTPGQLAKAEHVRPPSMTRTIERLEVRGYVRREADPQDGRQVLVFRTPAGDEFTQRSRELRTAWLAGQFDKLDPADQRVLRQAADALRRLSDLP